MLTQGQIALQLYTVRQETAKDFIGTLRRVAEIGYSAVELAGFGGVPVSELRAAMDEYGLRAMSAHIPITDIEARLPEVLADLTALGCDYLVIPFLPPERRGREHVNELVSLLNKAGAITKEAGLVLGYHNHAFEFESLAGSPAGETLFDHLIENTDPDLVAFELDIYWAAYAGVDPIAYLSRLSGRVPLIHLKDLGGTEAERVDVPFGTGTLPWPRIVDAANTAGAVWGIVEQDNPQDSLVDVATSLANARRLLGGEA